MKENGGSIKYVMTNGHDGLPKEYMPNLPSLRLIGVGYDSVDTKMAVLKDILVMHTPNVLNAKTSTTAILLMLKQKKELECEHYADLVQMANGVDYLICIVPGGPETKHMVNEEVMNALQPDGTLINNRSASPRSHGDDTGRLSCHEKETIRFSRGRTFLRPFSMGDNVILLPHVGSATVETQKEKSNPNQLFQRRAKTKKN